jgi:exopolyphosphatase / guanosine-5'-triphosphate,3'-diphosphate pyrophosphatase
MTKPSQGRLTGREPVSVVDIGSNSVRLVVYEGIVRAPTVLFNEKILCGLGKGIADTGRLNQKAVDSALAALKRFRALSVQAGAKTMHVLATAAAREAANGSAFIADAERILGVTIRVLTGPEEAYFSAMGIISSFHRPDGIAGDLGGGSLELVDVRDRTIGAGITMPLGGLRLSDMAGGSLSKAQKIAREHVSKAKLLDAGRGRAFYAVGGTWRNIAKLHMGAVHYPLHVMHEYEIPFADAVPFLRRVGKGEAATIDGIHTVSKNRQSLLAFGAIALLEVIEKMQPKSVLFSALGVREGYLYSLLPEDQQLTDPLISAAEELSVLRARSPIHAQELADWTGQVMQIVGIAETDNEARYRIAACLLADIGWRAHPDYRGAQSLNIIAHGAFVGIDHPGRAFMALANFFRHEGMIDDALSDDLRSLAPVHYYERAKLLGSLLRVVYLYSAAMPGVIPRLKLLPDGIGGFLFVVPPDLADLAGERTENRLQQFAKLAGRPMRTIVAAM